MRVGRELGLGFADVRTRARVLLRRRGVAGGDDEVR